MPSATAMGGLSFAIQIVMRMISCLPGSAQWRLRTGRCGRRRPCGGRRRRRHIWRAARARGIPWRAPPAPVRRTRRAPAAPGWSMRRAASTSARSISSRARADPALAIQEARVPVPAPAAVRMQPQILLQPLVRARPRPVRQIGGDRVGGLRDRAEALLRMRAHEALDLCDASTVDARRDIDQHQRREQRMVRRPLRAAFGEQRTRCRRARRRPPPAARRSRSASVSASTRASAAKSGKLIGAVRHPFGIAVAALIDRIGDPAHARDQVAGLAPGVAGLAAAMQQQHRRRPPRRRRRRRACCRPRR